MQTTIVARETGPALAMLSASSTTSCGDLGDLSPGAILTSKARFDPPADGCGNYLNLVPEALTTAALSDPGNSSATLTLPNGCVGLIFVEFRTLAADESTDHTSYLDDSLTNGEPHWWLLRRFVPDADAGACISANVVGCSDAFIAKNAVAGH